MEFTEVQRIHSVPRTNRYLIAMNGETKKAMTLYRYNQKLAQELFTLVAYFEIALRNAIDTHYTAVHGNDWLKDAAMPGGMFNNSKCGKAAKIISSTLKELASYSHVKLVSHMKFGFWRYNFAGHQYRAGGQSLLHIFPGKPASSPLQQYDHNYVFTELGKIITLRNRLAHHEPICFSPQNTIKCTITAREQYAIVLKFFHWMQIDNSSLLYGLDHVNELCSKIETL